MTKRVRNSKSAPDDQPMNTTQHHTLVRDVAWLVIITILLYISASLLSYSTADPGWSQTGSLTSPVHNMGGHLGAWIADVLFQLFGNVALLLPILLVGMSWTVLHGICNDSDHLGETSLAPALRLVGYVGTLISIAGLAHMRFYYGDVGKAGGILGKALIAALQPTIGALGASLFVLMSLLISMTLATRFSWMMAIERLGQWVLRHPRQVLAKRPLLLAWDAMRSVPSPEQSPHISPPSIAPSKRKPAVIQPLSTPASDEQMVNQEADIVPFQIMLNVAGEGGVPSLNLLDDPQPQAASYDDAALEALSRQIELILKDFRIESKVTGAYPGPVITRFEIEPAPGIKVSQINSLDKDIARGLSVKSVRVVDIIPGKSVIGLEIPNAQREMIYLSELMRSKEYEQAESLLTLGLGKEIGGRVVVADLVRMPHLLVAGTTGSGKSVAVNAMVLSLLYKASHKHLRLLMIDPKMLELSVYQGIPHLLAPVVTDMKEAANGLRWCVAEMERRYKLMSAVGVRNLAGFNKKVIDAQESGQPLMDPLFKPNPESDEGPVSLETLPFIVIIIDEFADMMMIVGKKVEELIARLAQKARAAGIHLILATQRPSVDVITGLIKANIPTRIAFQVSSKIDSRTILDQSGAETLLGHGDMLYLPPGTALPQRVHGAFVSDEEVHRIVESIKSTGSAQYIDGVLDELQPLGDGAVIGPTGLPEMNSAEIEDCDPLYDEAVRIVTESRRASISSVQRRLKVGYNRAARLIETMESVGIVSPPEHNGERTVLAPAPPVD